MSNLKHSTEPQFIAEIGYRAAREATGNHFTHLMRLAVRACEEFAPEANVRLPKKLKHEFPQLYHPKKVPELQLLSLSEMRKLKVPLAHAGTILDRLVTVAPEVFEPVNVEFSLASEPYTNSKSETFFMVEPLDQEKFEKERREIGKAFAGAVGRGSFNWDTSKRKIDTTIVVAPASVTQPAAIQLEQALASEFNNPFIVRLKGINREALERWSASAQFLAS